MKIKQPLKSETVFTYWEGKFPLVNRISTLSIQKVFKERHIHITPETLGDYIDVDKFPDWVFKTNVGHRSDTIRMSLLKEYGGWWFDCDILLHKNPQELIEDRAKSYIWTEAVSEKKFAAHGICAAIMYTPPNSVYINEVYRRGWNFQNSLKVDPESEEGWVDLMRECISKPALVPGLEVVVGDCAPFYNMDDMNHWWECWDGTLRLSNFQYGVQFNTSFIRRSLFLPPHYAELPDRILSLSSVEELKKEFPESNLAEYAALENITDAEINEILLALGHGSPKVYS
ncbi:capsular polysaccharide synthesis protein [Roseofilum casamattae]|uniref:Capsular polysaccharide synthesis protein n=1 Tax=Roseofilum casamattae BLCC-M143 TaxID=3022442 RepID=A0ABT7BYB8_9CYAN|nr:capsular polysaccharide synthesis protein [Roseofilum casamattae]MDJ1184194.1 capsular polysaccharide synthesis protein [Roseofilum casamattae BLCC-M143]